jgi:hypothetical protein
MLMFIKFFCFFTHQKLLLLIFNVAQKPKDLSTNDQGGGGGGGGGGGAPGQSADDINEVRFLLFCRELK